MFIVKKLIGNVLIQNIVKNITVLTIEYLDIKLNSYVNELKNSKSKGLKKK